MRAAQERVRRFHEAMNKIGARASVGDPVNPGIGNPVERELRARLILEEATEAMVALVGHATTERLMNNRLSDIEYGTGLVMQDTTEIAQELADVCVVTLGTAVAAGIDLAPVFDEVMSANERKVGPGARAREDGKLLKPEGWVGPDVAAVLQRQKAPRQKDTDPCTRVEKLILKLRGSRDPIDAEYLHSLCVQLFKLAAEAEEVAKLIDAGDAA